MKWIKYALAGMLVLGFSINAYADSSAVADQGQTQGQTAIGGMTGATALADQSQGQSQVAGGGTGGSVANSGNSAIGINNSFNGAAPIRYLPVPSAIPMENYQPGLFGNPNYQDHGPGFISMRQIVAAMNLVDLSSKVEGEKDIHILTQMLGKNPKPAAVVKPQFEINNGDVINHGFKPLAILTVEAEDAESCNSASLALAIGKKAKELGATRVIFLTEGSSKELESSGWGIGFSYNYATIGSKPSDSGSVGAGGTGYSQGKAAYSSLVYLTAIVGY